MTDRRSESGARGEELAVQWLTDTGYRVLERNVRLGRKEIDIICRTDLVTVFVEVKSGFSDKFGSPVFRVDQRKRRAIVEAAQQWIAGQPDAGGEFRFDVITVDLGQTPPRVEHLPGAFTADET